MNVSSFDKILESLNGNSSYICGGWSEDFYLEMYAHLRIFNTLRCIFIEYIFMYLYNLTWFTLPSAAGQIFMVLFKKSKVSRKKF